MTEIALDNDLLIKGACYFLLGEMVAAGRSTSDRTGVLGAARYVCQKVLLRRGLKAAWSFLSEWIEEFEQFEPSTAESLIAAEVELAAQREGLELDAGESLLLAIVENRKIERLLCAGTKEIGLRACVGGGV